MMEMIPNSVFYMAGVGVFIFIGLVIVEIIKQWIASYWRNGKGNRRQNDDRWTDNLVHILNNNGEKLVDISVDIREIKGLLKDGLHSDLTDIKTVIAKCHELNLIKEHDLRDRS